MFARSSHLQKALAAGAALGGSLLGFGVAKLSDDHVAPQSFAWSHHGAMSAFDAASIRRGFQVYREVCATCHSVDRIAFRNLVGVTHSEAEMKAIAEEYEVKDGPDDEGEMFERPAKLSDAIPGPYANEEAGRAANNGAFPPDLSLIVKARHAGDDYLFALLTGYMDPPAGKQMLPGLYYNPYFAGGAIAMPAPLMDEQVEYEDGTPATVSQMAKDVTTFLSWAAEPEHDYRKKAGMQWLFAIAVGLALTGFYKRFRWSPLKTRKITFK